MKIWLDGRMEAPPEFDEHCRCSDAAVKCLETDRVTHISFAYLLQADEHIKTGYYVACYIETRAYMDWGKPPTWEVHDATPAERESIDTAMRAAWKIWNDRHNLVPFTANQPQRGTQHLSTSHPLRRG